MEGFQHIEGSVQSIIQISGSIIKTVLVSGMIEPVIRLTQSIYQSNVAELWLLITGIWNDNGYWIDTETWID